MKKELKIIVIALVFAVVIAGTLIGIVYGLNLRDNPPVKLERIVINTKEDKVVLTENNASEKTFRESVTVVAKYSNGISETITDYVVLNFDSAHIGSQTVTLEYRGIKAAVLVEIIQEKPPITEENVIGTYDAEFYAENASIEIMKNKTYSLNAGDRTIAGAHELVDDNVLNLTMNGHNIKVVLDFEEKKITWFNVVEGVNLRRVYICTTDNQTKYRLSLYENQLIKWDVASPNEDYSFLAFGGYFYNADGSFIAFCLDEEYEIVLDNENGTFKLKKDEPIFDGKVYTLEQNTPDFTVKYTLTVEPDGYTLKTDNYEGDNLILTNTDTGKYILESNVLTLLNDENKRKAILNDENGTFDFSFIIYSIVHASAKDISFRLTLVDKIDFYDYLIEDCTLPNETVSLRSGTVEKSLFSDGFVNLGDEDLSYWVYYESNSALIVTEFVSGNYYLSTDLKTILNIKPNGEYTLTYNRNIVENGIYSIKNGRIVIGGRFLNLNENLFDFESDNTLKIECTLPTKFLLNGAIDIVSASLSIDTVSGEHIFVKLDQTEITNLSTENVGRFVAIVKYGEYLYRHVYEVYESEINVSLSVSNFPNTVQLNADLNVLDNLVVTATTNIGNQIQVDRSLITIDNFNTNEVGNFICAISYENLTLELDYEVCEVQVETGIALMGANSKYNQNDPINLQGMYIRVYYNYGNDVSIPVTADMVFGFTTEIRGRYVAQVKYKDFTVDYAYEVYPVFDIKSLSLNEWLEISATSETNYENMAKVSFTPSEDGEYVFTSESYYDSIGYLYNENLERLALDDDSGENLGFKIIYNLEAGKTYILAVRITNIDGKVKVLVVKNSEENGDNGEEL